MHNLTIAWCHIVSKNYGKQIIFEIDENALNLL